MWIANLLPYFRRPWVRHGRGPVVRRPAHYQLTLEPLEDRRLLSSGIVALGAFTPTAVNNLGVVVGSANGHAIIEQNSVITDLGTLGGTSSAAYGINDYNQVVGYAELADGTRHAALWQNGTVIDLGTLPGGTYSEAYDINNSGQIVGRAGLDAVLWSSAGIIQDLGTFGGTYAEAKAINNYGQVVGTTYGPLSATVWGFFWNPNAGGSLLAKAPYPNNQASQATDLNDAGQVVGSAGKIMPAGAFHGRYSGRCIDLWQNATSTPTNLSSIPDGSPLMSINNNSQVVGYGSSLWQAGTSIDLNSSLDPSMGWTISEATAINDAGQVVGRGTHNGVTSAFLLSFGTSLPPSISINDATVTEGNAGFIEINFTVTRSGPTDQITTVNFSTTNGTADAGSDYQVASGTLTFAPGDITKTITVLVNGDRDAETNETFLVNLSNPNNGVIADGQGAGAIVDDEPRISISDVTKSEGKKGVKTLFTFTVTLSAAYDQAVTMSFATANGTAKTSDGDYIARTGTLTFAPGDTTKTITIEVKGDGKMEADETFFVNLSGANNATILDGQGLGTILNDDH